MSAPGRPKRELVPLGGQRSGGSRKRGGPSNSAPGRPKREWVALGGKARSAKGAPQ